MPRRLLAALLLAALVDAPSGARQTAPGPVNLDFEAGTPGEAPSSWFVPRQQPGMSARTVTDDRRSGQQSAVLVRETGAAPGVSLNLWQQFDATKYRGQRVRFRMAVRTDSAASRAQLWLRIEGAAAGKADPPVLFLDNMDDRPITGSTWADYDIVADVPAGAARIGMGVFLVGPGRAWVDAASFETVGRVESRAPEGPRPLARRGLLNVLAFTRLAGAVRYFHPSDEAAGADWDGFVVAGMRVVEAAPDAASLAKQLGTLFRPIAPAVTIALSGALPDGGSAETPPSGTALLTWRHSGFGAGSPQAPYRSERVQATTAASVDLELGGGVAARVPLTAAGGAGTTAGSAAPAVPYPTRQRFSVADRATRLAAVAIAWSVPQHFYPYFDVVKGDWSAALRTALQEAATDRNAAEFTATLQRMLAALHDGQARAYPADFAELQFVPALVIESVQDELLVTYASPSLGAAAGDRVISVEGVPAPLATEAVEALVSGATPQWVRRRVAEELLAGPRDAPVKLRLDRAGAPAAVEVALPRTERGFAPPPRLDAIAELQPGIFYVDVTRVTDATFADALPKLAAARGVAFDFRGTPAIGPEPFFTRLVGDSVAGPQWHIPQPARPDRAELPFGRAGEWRIAPRAPRLAARLVFLADERAIGFTESYLAIVEQYRLGEIVGSATAGTSGAVSRFSVPGDYAILFTGTKTLKQNGSQHHGIGIAPSVPASRTRAGVTAGRDEILERAIEMLSK